MTQHRNEADFGVPEYERDIASLFRGSVRYSKHIQSAPSISQGRKGDPRMHRAVAAKLADPNMSLLDALLAGGFEFANLGIPGASDRTVRDTNNILLYQRKNQLNRRIRTTKKMEQKIKSFPKFLSTATRDQVTDMDTVYEVGTRDKISNQCPSIYITEAQRQDRSTRQTAASGDSFMEDHLDISSPKEEFTNQYPKGYLSNKENQGRSNRLREKREDSFTGDILDDSSPREQVINEYLVRGHSEQENLNRSSRLREISDFIFAEGKMDDNSPGEQIADHYPSRDFSEAESSTERRAPRGDSFADLFFELPESLDIEMLENNYIMTGKSSDKQ